jgi:hypothetical protein
VRTASAIAIVLLDAGLRRIIPDTGHRWTRPVRRARDESTGRKLIYSVHKQQIGDTMVDQTALRANQVTIIGTIVLAFVLGADRGGGWLVLVLGLALALGAARPAIAPIRLAYLRVLVPLGVLKPSPVPDDPAPHRFAQAVGATFLLAAAVLLFAGAPLVGWALAWIVVTLAAVNLLAGFCAGCFMYVQLQRAGLLRRRHQTAR